MLNFACLLPSPLPLKSALAVQEVSFRKGTLSLNALSPELPYVQKNAMFCKSSLYYERYVRMALDIVPFQTGVPIITTSYEAGSFLISSIVVSLFRVASSPDLKNPRRPHLLFVSIIPSMSQSSLAVIASATFFCRSCSRIKDNE